MGRKPRSGQRHSLCRTKAARLRLKFKVCSKFLIFVARRPASRRAATLTAWLQNEWTQYSRQRLRSPYPGLAVEIEEFSRSVYIAGLGLKHDIERLLPRVCSPADCGELSQLNQLATEGSIRSSISFAIAANYHCALGTSSCSISIQPHRSLASRARSYWPSENPANCSSKIRPRDNLDIHKTPT